jgi:hypothetical protein
LARQKVVAIG